ncbi:hypothetical protein B0J13DRAFT_567241 [Dactylonectria estremocensis]|uniref:Nucleoside phosphorylase domain-containing protein n=1 Tax=Dactylonectria estremocensis TaxID=1079267 RepID=A0A9P9DNI9_9HYPO|nr:hypothetical protein B0J13DRAFT_567241 [Dactylonectria estremocensis]
MDLDFTVDYLQNCAWEISEIIRTMARCPHAKQPRPNEESNQLCHFCMTIQTKLGIISVQIESNQEAGFDPDIEEKARNLWRLLEDMCSWSQPFHNPPLRPHSKQPCANLHTLVEDKSQHRALRRNITSYLRQPSFILEGFITKCDGLSTLLQTDDSEETIEIPEPEDHSRAQKQLFHMLSVNTACDSCQLRTGNQEANFSHPARVFLMGSTKSEDDLVGFDIIMSSLDNKSWQDLCIMVPASTGKRVTFADIDEACCGLSLPDKEQLDRFCQIFKDDDGCRISLKLEDEVLFRLGVEALKHRASPGKGLCLADVLQRYTLTVEEKLALAYVISSAFWQFYESSIMNRAWSSRNIWFMPQPDLRDNSEQLPLKAYLSFDSEATECDFDACEFAETRSLIHRCPRIQALAILLLEIGLGRPLEYKKFDRQTQQLNYRYAEASEYLEELKAVTWENFAHKYIFTDAVEACLKFDALMGKGEHSGSDDSHNLRRKLLHQRVVSHMIWLNRSFRGSNGKVRYLSEKQFENDSLRTNESRSSSKLEDKSFEPEKLVHATSSLSLGQIHARNPLGFEKRTRPSSALDFGIGIICALTIEANAVEALFDDNWDDGPSYNKDRGDKNAYSTGSIGCHNVVLAYMPGMGKGSAATVATHLSRSFPNIRLAIVVGICGVVPFAPGNNDEIILGDVVVSEGIITYDFGRRLPEGFKRKDSHQEALGRPPAEVRSILAKLKGFRGQHEWRTKMAELLNELQREPALKAEYPGAQNDKLFQASYRHIKDSLTCQQAGCQGRIVRRRRLTQGTTQPAIHFGLMGSADTVMKSGVRRDSIAKSENILGFEMEGAGVWDTFPSCLVIKGACDYADSHKTKAWQQYASATAAACTKAFLTIGYQSTTRHQ